MGPARTGRYAAFVVRNTTCTQTTRLCENTNYRNNILLARLPVYRVLAGDGFSSEYRIDAGVPNVFDPLENFLRVVDTVYMYNYITLQL